MAERAPRYSAMVDFHQHQERLYVVLEEDHEKVEKQVAELEGLLRYVRESAIYDNTVQAERIDAALAGQQQAEPKCSDGGDCGIGGYCKECPLTATHSEDGREVAEVWRLVPTVPTQGMRDAGRALLANGEHVSMGKVFRAMVAAAPQPARQVPVDSMAFEYRHPATGERHTVTVTREEVKSELEDLLFEKLNAKVCRCEPVGETNVVDCICCDYTDDFDLMDAQPARQVAGEEMPALPDGWLIELGFDVLDRQFRFIESKSHTPTIKLILPACEVDDSSAWNLRDDVASRISSALAPAAVVSDTDIEMTAQLIYTQWDAVAGYVPWVKGGNSTQQDYARKLARDLFARLNRRAIPVVMPEAIATILPPDPYDDRSGFAVSLVDRIKLEALPSGTKLYAEPLNSKAIPLELLGRIEASATELESRFEDDQNGPGWWECPACSADCKAVWSYGKIVNKPEIKHSHGCWLIELRALLGKR